MWPDTLILNHFSCHLTSAQRFKISADYIVCVVDCARLCMRSASCPTAVKDVGARFIQRHTTSRHELDGLRAIVEHDLNDATVRGLSADRQFATAYNVVIQLAKIVIACAGSRVVGRGHHLTTFEALELAMGRSVTPLARYFETCRRKRNMLDYDMAIVATETEVRGLLEKAEEFRVLVEQWSAQRYPQFLA